MAFWQKKEEPAPSELEPAGDMRPNSARPSFSQKDNDTTMAGRAPARSSSVVHSPPNNSELSESQKRSNATASKQRAATFGEIVAVLMRSAQYKHHSLADLEWLVLPPILLGQFSLAEARSEANGLIAPIGVILWAAVGDEVDKRLSAAVDQPIKLKPAEWNSGALVWVVEALGNPRVINAMVQRLSDTEWKGRVVKLRARDKNGMPAVAELRAASAEKQ